MESKKNMKKVIASLGIVATLLGGSITVHIPEAEAAATSSKAWYTDSMNYLVKQGIMEKSSTSNMNAYLTRAEFAYMLAKSLGLNLKQVKDVKYKDISKNYKYYKAIAAVSNAGLLRGTSTNLFSPNKGITRSEMAVLLSKAFGFAEKKNAKLPFKDVPINFSAKGAIAAMVDAKIMTGVSATYFAPTRQLKRSDTAVILHRALLAYKAKKSASNAKTSKSITQSKNTAVPTTSAKPNNSYTEALKQLQQKKIVPTVVAENELLTKKEMITWLNKLTGVKTDLLKAYINLLPYRNPICFYDLPEDVKQSLIAIMGEKEVNAKIEADKYISHKELSIILSNLYGFSDKPILPADIKAYIQKNNVQPSEPYFGTIGSLFLNKIIETKWYNGKPYDPHSKVTKGQMVWYMKKLSTMKPKPKRYDQVQVIDATVLPDVSGRIEKGNVLFP
jgi:hypothetical protein